MGLRASLLKDFARFKRWRPFDHVPMFEGDPFNGVLGKEYVRLCDAYFADLHRWDCLLFDHCPHRRKSMKQSRQRTKEQA